ncbi:sideroflexin-5-like isoform X1 [Octopus vulgaris]|uniref:Sidoreflexin n=1 Tax=Octopus vulgaris TaxID=6645 RepID=A0AA36FG75_OCTVU|nr:sideroflexin-5-like isoform X1 [Octopus vulgaris]
MSVGDTHDGYPPFQLDSSRFNQETFTGRLLHFLDVIDPRTLLVSDKKLQSSIQLLELYRKGQLPDNVPSKQLWEAQKVKQAIIHPDTGEKIFMPFRMSGFVPFGSPFVIGMLLPNPTIGKTILWQWMNQSHNACVNYANRNATKPTPMKRFIVGYVGAVSTAVSIAVGISVLIEKAERFSPATKIFIKRFVPFPAVATASTCNVVLMRNSEIPQGIEVFDSNNKPLGSSVVAAKVALFQTALTRMFLPAPILIIPPLIMSLLEKTKLLRTYPKLHLPFNATVCTLTFGCALPVAIALFPQTCKIRVEKMEAEIRGLTTEECDLTSSCLGNQR